MKNINKNRICSYSIIGLPYESKWKISANCTNILFAPPQPLQQLATTQFFCIFAHGASHWSCVGLSSRNIYPPLPHQHMQSWPYWKANMFLQRIWFGYQKPISPINDTINIAFDLCGFPLNTHNRFCPRKFNNPWILKTTI